MAANQSPDGHGSVHVDERSLLGDYMTRQSLGRRKELAGIASGRKLAGMFVANEVLVNARDKAAIGFLVDHCGGELLPAKPLPPAPREMHGSERSLDGMPQTVTVRIKGAKVPLDALDRLLRQQSPEPLEFSSRAGAGTLAAVQSLRERGLAGHPNLAGTTDGFPLLSSTESFPGSNDAYVWPEYAGKSNIAKAWQLCQALDNVRSMKHPIFLAVLDVGFAFIPPVDFASLIRFNLTNEGAPIDGPASIGGYPWHGSAVAGVAAAVLDNGRGAAGVAGLPVGAANLPVAIPVLFRTDIVISEIYRCLDCCVAWGVDVLNISLSITWPKLLLPLDRDWDDKFQFAKDQGLIVVASAANNGAELPDKVVFPATRTPGVITVGALDASGNAARSDSNYGSSVDVWAPGTNIHTVPDPGSAQFFFNATSAAAPVVAGVAALLRSVNPLLKPDDVKFLLRDTAWTDSPDWKSNRILNAYQAVLKAINFALPPGTFEEPNDTPASARPMVQSGTLAQPLGETVISWQGDVDFHRFSTTDYADVVLTLKYVRPLSIVLMEVIPDTPDSLLFNDFTDNRSPGTQVISFKQAQPGSFVVKVHGQAPNYYKLQASIVPKPLEPDIFEDNQTKEKAARIKLRTRDPLIDGIGLHTFYQGAYEANILTPSDVDWYHVQDVGQRTLSFPCCKLLNADAPLDVRLYGPDGALLGSHNQVKHAELHLPEPECWIEVRSSKVTRYAIFFGYMLDKSKLPPPHQREDVEIVPKWWPDPAFRVDGWEKWVEIVVDDALRQHGTLELQADGKLQFDLLSPERAVLQSAAPAEGNRQILKVDGLAPGRYLVRVGREAGAAARFQPDQQALVKFTLGPSF